MGTHLYYVMNFFLAPLILIQNGTNQHRRARTFCFAYSLNQLLRKEGLVSHLAVHIAAPWIKPNTLPSNETTSL